MSGDPLIPPLSLLLKIQQETRFGEMSKLDIEFKKRQLSIMLCPMQTLRFPHWRNKKFKLLIWTWIKINTKTQIFSSLAKIRSHYAAVANTCIVFDPWIQSIEKEIPTSFMFLHWGSFVSVAPTCTYFSAITHFLHCLSPPKSSRANKKSTKSHITVSMFCKSCAERHYTHLVTLYRMRRAQPLRCG